MNGDTQRLMGSISLLLHVFFLSAMLVYLFSGCFKLYGEWGGGFTVKFQQSVLGIRHL